jgi:hypothetical protein
MMLMLRRRSIGFKRGVTLWTAPKTLRNKQKVLGRYGMVRTGVCRADESSSLQL